MKRTNQSAKNKSWTLRVRTKDRHIFLEVREGLKTVETRAATPKYRDVKKGDTLVFVCGKERLKKTVRRVRIFKSIASMTHVIPYKKIMPSLSSAKNIEAIYHGYPGYREKIKRYGLIAFDL